MFVCMLGTMMNLLETLSPEPERFVRLPAPYSSYALLLGGARPPIECLAGATSAHTRRQPRTIIVSGPFAGQCGAEVAPLASPRPLEAAGPGPPLRPRANNNDKLLMLLIGRSPLMKSLKSCPLSGGRGPT